MEEFDDGEIKTIYSVKISRYMTPNTARGLALRGHPKPQMYFERPLQYYFNLGFQNGFVLDGFAERAFPPDQPTGVGGYVQRDPARAGREVSFQVGRVVNPTNKEVGVPLQPT